MVNHLNNLAETKPLVVGAAGTTAGVGATALKWLNLVGGVAGSIGAILGVIVAVLSIALLIKQLKKD